AYRGLPRPSSAPGAKASTVCHNHLATTDTRCSRTLSTNQNTSHKPTYNTRPPPAPPPKNKAGKPETREAGSSTGVASGKTPTHTHRQNQQERGLLPQTPNSAPPGSSRNPGESSILTAIPTEGTSTRRRSPSIGSTFESADQHRK